MKFISLQQVNMKNTWARTLYFVWILSAGVVINNTGGRTDIFLTFGVMPMSFSLSIGLTHFAKDE
jgi:hypothetical protein